MLNIIGKRYFFFALSLFMIIPGLVIIAIEGFPLSIDFQGGSIVEIDIQSTKAPSTDQIIALYNSLGITDSQVQVSQSSGETVFVIRSTSLDQEKYSQVIASLKKDYDPELVQRRFDTVSPAISQSVGSRAMLAVGVAALAVIIYITFAFRGIPHAFRYGVCAIIAMLHDILIVISLGAIGSKFFGWQMDSLYLTALLTVIGFSTQDKIVVFDRIRENSPIFEIFLLRNLSTIPLFNHCSVQSTPN